MKQSLRLKILFIGLTFLSLQFILINSVLEAEQQFIRVVDDDATLYDNRSGALIPLGSLVNDEIYPVQADYGNWHQLQFGDYSAYVHKRHTTSATNNKQTVRPNRDGNPAITKSETTVYDNSSGRLVPFAVLNEGVTLTVDRDYGNWWEVTLQNRKGYLKKAQVNVQFNQADRYFKVNTDTAVVYDNRGGSLSPIATLVQGETYQRISDYGNWHQLDFGDYYGYVHKRETTLGQKGNEANFAEVNDKSKREFTTKTMTTVYDNTSGALEPFVELEAGINGKILRSYGNWWEVSISGRTGYLKKANVSIDFLPEDDYFKVKTETAIVYDNRGEKLTAIAQLVQGETYRRVSSYGDWHQLDFGGYFGYVHQRETALGRKQDEANFSQDDVAAERSFVTREATIVYDNTSGTLEPFVTLEQGVRGKIRRDYGNWWEVSISGRTGYLKKANVAIDFLPNDRYFEPIEEQPLYQLVNRQMVEVGTLKENQTYQRIRSTRLYHLIEIGDQSFWVRRSLTRPVLGETLKSYKKTATGSLTTNQTVTVYDNEQGYLDPIAELSAGTTLEIQSDYGNWLAVDVAGRRGYLLKRLLDFSLVLASDVVNPKRIYGYKDMQADIHTLDEQYGDLISTQIIGKSVEGRNLYAVRLGHGSREIFINGAHHAREWLTTNVTMEMIDAYSQAYVRGEKIQGYDVKGLLNQVTMWFVPMVNPDGVELVQMGRRYPSAQTLSQLNGQSLSFDRWKANIRGVDLNQQYPYLWYQAPVKAIAPNYQDYRGSKPLSEPEAKAVFDFTNRHAFEAALSYHSSGEVLYTRYQYGQDIAPATRGVGRLTGYQPVNLGATTMTARGYTDWFVATKHKIGMTVEIAPSIGPRPVPLWYWDSIWRKNQAVPLYIADYLID